MCILLLPTHVSSCPRETTPWSPSLYRVRIYERWPVLKSPQRQAFKRDCPDFFETLLGGSFREFNAAMIAGISIIIDPTARHAGQMREIVRSFMEHFGHGFDLKSDGFSKKEAAIVCSILPPSSASSA